jgi:maleamate amidohydrolase
MSSDIEREYLQSGFNQRLGFGNRPVLLMIDYVRAYLTVGNALYAGVEESLTAAQKLLSGARSAKVPVIHTRVFYDDSSQGGQFFRKAGALKNFVGENIAGQICEEVAPQGDESVILKHFASAFFGTSLNEMLRSLKADTVIIAGLSTSGCVRATAVDAIQFGYIPIVVREAVGDRAPGPHEASLFDLDAKYADVLGLNEVLEYFDNN